MGLVVCVGVAYSRKMRIHVHLDEELVERLDARVGARRRSRFIESATRLALEDEERWRLIEQAIGSIDDAGHEWDADPAAWVRTERRADVARVG